MASFIDNMKINTAITESTKLDLGHQHITTTNFMQLQPVLCKEMVPGERCDVNLMTFARMQPLAVPTFGRANIKERAFFVPMRTIFRGWNDFITDTPHIYSGAKSPTKGVDDIDELGGVNYPQVPTVSNATLLNFLTGSSLPGPNWVILRDTGDAPAYAPITATDADVYIANSSGVGKYYRFTTEGKQVMKILESLGYKLVWDFRNQDVYSALPLLAIAKIYCDWYFPAQYVGTGSYVDIMGLLNYDGSAAAVLSTTDLANIFGWITYVNFDSDYFVNAWDNPVAPVGGVYSQFKITDITSVSASPANYGLTANAGSASRGDWYHPFNSTNGAISDIGVANISTNGTPVTVMKIASTQNTGSVADRLGMSVSDFQHKALTSLTDYMKRHQLVGARAMDRYLARFGKQLNTEQLNRCNYIGSKMVPLQIGDVFSSSNMSATGTTGGLGEFAGKGMAMEQNFSFDWSTNEYGFLIVMCSLVPAASIYQGLDRKVMHIGRLDFWTPEFDNLGVQAISERELYNNYSYANLSNSSSNYMSWDDTVFGFAPRYGEYKYAKDNVTGDFVMASQTANTMSNAAENSWHLMRTFTDLDFRSGGSYSFANMPHSRNFMQGTRDHYQFDRIFNYLPTDGNGHVTTFFYPDPITCIYDFQMVSFSPMKALYETYEFEDKGQKVQEQAGGVKAN